MTEDLQKTIGTLQSRVTRLLAKSPNEQETKQALITPMLRALGWDCEEDEAVRLEYRYRGQGNPVDYALMDGDRPLVFVEAKSLGRDLGDYRWRAQTVNYANSAGVNWCVLTDGNFWLVYKSNAEGDLDQMLFLETCLHPLDGKRPPCESNDLFSLLSQESIAGDKLGSRWQRMDVDRRGTRALRDLFTKRDAALVRLVQKRSDLSKTEVLDLLSRSHVTIGSAGGPAPPTPPVPPHSPPPPETPSDGVRVLVLKEEKGITGRCRMEGEGENVRFVVLKGSCAVLDEVVDKHILDARPEHTILRTRRALVETGVLAPAPDGGRLQFTRDHEFARPSTPAGIMLGRSASGNECWQDESGRPLKEFTPIPIKGKTKKS